MVKVTRSSTVETYAKGEGHYTAQQEVWGWIPGLIATISEIGYLLILSRDMTEILLK